MAKPVCESRSGPSGGMTFGHGVMTIKHKIVLSFSFDLCDGSIVMEWRRDIALVDAN